MRTLDLKFIQYLNLFEKYTHVRTKHCFEYNNYLIFVVPSALVSKAIGPKGTNVRKLSSVINKKIKVVAMPLGIQDAEKFIADIVEPVKFRSLEVKGDVIVITAGSAYKAALIGRNKRRLNELKEIVKSYFNDKDVKIV